MKQMRAPIIFLPCLLYEFSTSDDLPNGTDSFQTYQLKCIRKLFRIDDFELNFETLFRDGLVTDEAQIPDPCAWIGVTCSNSIIRKLYWSPSTKPKRTACLGWIPPSVASFHLVEGTTAHIFSTQLLPRELEAINITSCRVDGSLDLTALPAPMTDFNGSINHFTGTLVLENLPQNIRHIRLERTKITAVVFSNERLPISLERLTCTRTEGKIRLIEAKGEKPDKRISVRVEAGEMHELPRRGRRGKRDREIN